MVWRRGANRLLPFAGMAHWRWAIGCLWSRLANRVLLVISRFPTVDAETLYQGVHAVDWAEHLLPSGSLAVEFSGRGSGIDNTHFGALKVKDAIVDRLRSASGERPSIDKLDPDLRVHLRLDKGQAVLSLDLSVTACINAAIVCSKVLHH